MGLLSAVSLCKCGGETEIELDIRLVSHRPQTRDMIAVIVLNTRMTAASSAGDTADHPLFLLNDGLIFTAGTQLSDEHLGVKRFCHEALIEVRRKRCGFSWHEGEMSQI